MIVVLNRNRIAISNKLGEKRQIFGIGQFLLPADFQSCSFPLPIGIASFPNFLFSFPTLNITINKVNLIFKIDVPF